MEDHWLVILVEDWILLVILVEIVLGQIGFEDWILEENLVEDWILLVILVVETFLVQILEGDQMEDFAVVF